MAAFFLFNSSPSRKIQGRRRRRPLAKAYLISCANIRQPFVINQPIQDCCQRWRHQNMLVKVDEFSAPQKGGADTLFSHHVVWM